MTRIELSEAAAATALAGLRDEVGGEALVDAYARIVWSVLAEPGDGAAGALIAELGPASALVRALEGSGADAAGVDRAALSAGRARWIPRAEREAVDAAVASARRAEVRVIVPGDPQWPARIDDLGVHAPTLLWARGDPKGLAADVPAVAIVGARAATSYGSHVAAELAAELAGSGITIVSGAAYGIDGAAHRAALGAGGQTVALLAGGVDRPYPTGHSALIDAIAGAGGVIAETPCGTAPTKWRFLARNRIIAALSDVTVVVEAGARSGSLNTAAHAAALGRSLGAVPGPVTSAASAGCHRMLREFDAVCITGAGDVLELLGVGSSPLGVDEGHTGAVSRVLDALSTRVSRGVIEIARRSGLSEPDAEALLGIAALSGDALRADDGWRRAASVRGERRF
jgi:DNA processing protein